MLWYLSVPLIALSSVFKAWRTFPHITNQHADYDESTHRWDSSIFPFYFPAYIAMVTNIYPIPHHACRRPLQLYTYQTFCTAPNIEEIIGVGKNHDEPPLSPLWYTEIGYGKYQGSMIYCRIWSWSPVLCEKHGPRDSVDKNRGRRPRFLSLLRPEGHVFHTARETMIKSYYSTLSDWFFPCFIHINMNFSALKWAIFGSLHGC